MRTLLRFSLLVIAVTLLPGCGAETGADSSKARSGKPQVYVVNYPLYYFTQRIAGDLVDLHFPVPPDVDPAYWSPSVEEVAKFQQADLIVLNGAKYAKWVPKHSLPDSKKMWTVSSKKNDLIEVEEGVAHRHGDGPLHTHKGLAFTTWMDPQLAVAQAEKIKTVLEQMLPQHAEQLQSNFEGLKVDLDHLNQEFSDLLKKFKETPLVASHPVYQYFARCYNLNMKSVHWEPETIPDEKAVTELTQLLEKHPAKLMIWESEPALESIAFLLSRGLKSVTVDPCGNRPEKGDYLSVMQQNLENLRTALP